MELKKIVLITSGQPSTNPRLVKEADVLVSAGYQVTVVYQYWNAWATEKDQILLTKKKWKAIRVGGSPTQNKLIYFFTRILYKVSKLIFQKFGPENGKAEWYLLRTYRLMYLKVLQLEADLLIGHNLGALAICVKAAKKKEIKCGFDGEDFHRQEVTDNKNAKEYKLAKYIEDKYLPKVDYLTVASPLIASEYKKLYPFLNPNVINNVFPLKNIPTLGSQSANLDSPLKLFWFSQTIGKGRGLEDVIAALQQLNNNDFQLHLLGNISLEVKLYFEALADDVKIYFYEPIAPDDLFEFAAKFDIGLALEPAFCLNNDLALSNKLFSYAVSGLAVIASETSAQKQFMETYPNIGKTYKIGDSDALATILTYYAKNRNDLYAAKKASFDLAKNELNWELESKKFIAIINSVLN